MNCVDLVCGTGGWSGPKPGDPDTGNVSLTATPGFGGINVAWTYPNVNPFAVAYTVVYRGSSSSFSSAIEIARVAGNRYLDPMELKDSGLYYYWIRMVSVHGTEGSLIGPAECRMRSTVGQIIDDLSGEISEGVLHRALLEKIDRIQMLGDGLLGESRAREQDILAVSQTIEGLQVAVDSATAAISTETLARITTIDALARELTTLQAEFNDRTAILQQEIGVLVTETESIARAVTVAQVAADEANAAFRSEQQARINADSALAAQINTVESEMGGNLAQARQTLQTEINTVNGKVTAIGARYTVQVQANGLAGGFGIYNNGSTVDAGFIADRFWIGSTAANKRKPFVIKNGVTYIDQAMIENASITTAKISNFSAEVGNIANASITNATIDFARIRNVRIDSAHIGSLQLGSENIAWGAVTNAVAGQTSFSINVGIGGNLLVFFQGSPYSDFTQCTVTAPGGWTLHTMLSYRSVSTGPTTSAYRTSTELMGTYVNSGTYRVNFNGGYAVAFILKR